MSYELKNIKVLGYTTDFNQCECCGKSDLRGTVSILDLNTDVVLHFGTTCAVNANKYDDLNALSLVKKEISFLKRDREDSIKFAAVMSRKFKLESKIDTITNDYLKFREAKENRIKRFSWESYL